MLPSFHGEPMERRRTAQRAGIHGIDSSSTILPCIRKILSRLPDMEKFHVENFISFM